MKIVTIIVTYNSLKNNWLPACIESLEKSRQETDIIIVDNNSTDDTQKYVRMTHPHITMIASKKNLGFGGGNNLGIAEALKTDADYFFLLNQDAKVNEETLGLLLDAATRNKEYAIFSPIHLNYEGTELEYYFEKFMTSGKSPGFYYDHIFNVKKDIYSTSFVNAAAWFIHKNIFFEIGGFDPMFFQYGEDDNYCQRVIYHGYKIGVVPGSYIFHDSMIRSVVENKVSSPKYLSQLEIRHKAIYGNINSDMQLDLRNEKKAIYYKMLVSIIFLKFVNLTVYYRELSSIKSWFAEIEKSRVKNKCKGLHYVQL